MLIAGIVWLIAGFNVARLGILSYLEMAPQWYLFLLTIAVFSLFGTMFYKMSQKHTKRIMGYEEYRPFWHFFDLKAYIIMVCMMGGGIGLRAAEYSLTFSFHSSTLGSAAHLHWQELYLSKIILAMKS